MVKRNASKRRRSRTQAILKSFSNPVPTPESCEQCRIAHHRIRFSISLTEAQEVIAALNSDQANTNTDLRDYFQAHLTIALRRDSYEYE